MTTYLLVITAYIVAYGIIKIVMSSVKNPNKNWYSGLFILFFGGISAFRNHTVGTDTNLYAYLYQHMGMTSGITTLKNSKFPLYELYNVILYKLGESPQIIIIFNAFVVIILMSSVIYFWENQYFVVSILYVTLYFFFISMNISRQFVAMSILMFGVTELFKGKRVKFWTFYFMAILIHSTAVIGIVFYVLFRIKWTFRKNLILIGLTAATLLLYSKLVNLFIIIFPIYGGYLGESRGITLETQSNGNQLILTLFYLMFVILGNYFIARDYDLNYKDYQKLRFLNAIMIISTMIGIFFYNNILINRISIYFTIYAILYIPKILKLISKKLTKNIFKQKIILNYLDLVTIIITFIPMIFQLAKNISGVVPYSFM